MFEFNYEYIIQGIVDGDKDEVEEFIKETGFSYELIEERPDQNYQKLSFSYKGPDDIYVIFCSNIDSPVHAYRLADEKFLLRFEAISYMSNKSDEQGDTIYILHDAFKTTYKETTFSKMSEKLFKKGVDGKLNINWQMKASEKWYNYYKDRVKKEIEDKREDEYDDNHAYKEVDMDDIEYVFDYNKFEADILEEEEYEGKKELVDVILSTIRYVLSLELKWSQLTGIICQLTEGLYNEKELEEYQRICF